MTLSDSLAEILTALAIFIGTMLIIGIVRSVMQRKGRMETDSNETKENNSNGGKTEPQLNRIMGYDFIRVMDMSVKGNEPKGIEKEEKKDMHAPEQARTQTATPKMVARGVPMHDDSEGPEDSADYKELVRRKRAEGERARLEYLRQHGHPVGMSTTPQPVSENKATSRRADNNEPAMEKSAVNPQENEIDSNLPEGAAVVDADFEEAAEIAMGDWPETDSGMDPDDDFLNSMEGMESEYADDSDDDIDDEEEDDNLSQAAREAEEMRRRYENGDFDQTSEEDEETLKRLNEIGRGIDASDIPDTE